MEVLRHLDCVTVAYNDESSDVKLNKALQSQLLRVKRCFNRCSSTWMASFGDSALGTRDNRKW
jgi:hypothetical protein